MKNICLLLIFLCFVLLLQAQVSKTVEASAGNLYSCFISSELDTITHLTITGMLDARDFKLMRDSMPALTAIDLTWATIAAYSGTDGTYQDNYLVDYPAHEIPIDAFKRKTSLAQVRLPLSAQSIGKGTFSGCTGLTAVTIAPSVISINDQAFLGCINLQSIDLPGLLTKIGYNTFGGCTALTTVNIPSSVTELGEAAFSNCHHMTSIRIPSSVTSIRKYTFSGCNGFTSFVIPSSITSIGAHAFYGCWRLKSIVIPTSVTSIGDGSFSFCPDLTSITIPSSVVSIGKEAFYGCDGLTSITANASSPIDISHSRDVFSSKSFTYCKLIVPYQSGARYAVSAQWKDFESIEEASSGIALDRNHLETDADKHSYTVGISANMEWTVKSTQPWLSFDASSENGRQKVTLTIEANPEIYRRIGQVTVSSASDSISQIITVTQEGASKTITLTPGNLLSSLTEHEMKVITTLTLDGTMDARDFKTIRNKMPLLTTLDLSHATVAAYSGTEGTIPDSDSTIYYYNADAIPRNAFSNPYDYHPYVAYTDENINKDKFKTIVLPTSITAIGRYAFIDCDGLTSIRIPEGVQEIDNYAFNQCNNLSSVGLPSSLLNLGTGVFEECTDLESVEIPSFVTTISAGAFARCTSLKSVSIPVAVTTIGNDAFSYCKSLKAITIPDAVTSVGYRSFNYCSGLTSLEIPSMVTSIGSEAFGNCSGLTTITVHSGIPIDLSDAWGVFTGVNTASCKLQVPYQSRTRYAEANQWMDFKNIVELTTAIREFELNMPSIKCYPNPFTQQMSIEVENPSCKAVSVEIYSISGQKIKTLARALKESVLGLQWKGDDEQGNQVPVGMYIMKVNRQTRQVVMR